MIRMRRCHFLRSGEAFACISSSNAPLHGCNAIDIGEMSYHCVCTPDFKERYLKKEITKRTLIRAPGIVFSVRDDIHMEYFGQLFKSRPPLALTHIVPSTEGLKKLVLSGLAYGLLPWRIINKYVERGQLVDLFPKKTMKVPLYWHHWRLNMGMHTLLSDAVISYAKQHRL